MNQLRKSQSICGGDFKGLSIHRDSSGYWRSKGVLWWKFRNLVSDSTLEFTSRQFFRQFFLIRMPCITARFSRVSSGSPFPEIVTRTVRSPYSKGRIATPRALLVRGKALFCLRLRFCLPVSVFRAKKLYPPLYLRTPRAVCLVATGSVIRVSKRLERPAKKLSFQKTLISPIAAMAMSGPVIEGFDAALIPVSRSCCPIMRISTHRKVMTGNARANTAGANQVVS